MSQVWVGGSSLAWNFCATFACSWDAFPPVAGAAFARCAAATAPPTFFLGAGAGAGAGARARAGAGAGA